MTLKLRSATATVMTVALASLVGCGGGDDDPGTGTGAASSGGMGGHMSMESCEMAEADTFSAGMAKTGEEGLEIMIMEADPAPPVVGDNVWMLHVNDADGSMVMGADIEVKPWMTVHGHGSNRTPVVTETDGMYTVERINFSMTGVWDTTVTVTTTDGTTDSAVFSFCVE